MGARSFCGVFPVITSYPLVSSFKSMMRAISVEVAIMSMSDTSIRVESS